MQRRIRQSQTVVPFGVGAIFDFKGESLVGCDIRHWGHHGETIHSERLTRALGVDQLRAAPVVDTRGWAAAAVPYARFPSWLFCPQCRRMTRWNRSMERPGRPPECGDCPGRRQLVPMRWIQICPHGHMDDIDWSRWAHSRSPAPQAERCRQADGLTFETSPGAGGGGLSTLQVRCRACQAQRNLSDITAKGSLRSIGSSCNGRQPWQRWEDRTTCDEMPLAVQRGASNVYFPLIHSSIEIPNPSRADAHSERALAIKSDPLFAALLGMEPRTPFYNMAVQQLAGHHKVATGFVIALLQNEIDRAAGTGRAVATSPGDLLDEEWVAFVTEQQTDDDPDFRTRHVPLSSGVTTELTQAIGDRIDKVVLADRLREVRALEGFHRATPAGRDRLVSVALNHRDIIRWLPAMDVRGEGIFLSLDEDRLRIWEETDSVRRRIHELDQRLRGAFMELRLRERTGPQLLPRYVLLHTFAHLLIRRLAFESGYAATSIRERIYARSTADPGTGADSQAGVLIYTAAGDSEGTLGGLVRQGEPPNLQSTILQAIEDAMWCSSDPLCGENLASTFGGLNLAACHSCTLVAETSCESGNYLLDRALVIGGAAVPGYFQPVLEEAIRVAGEGVRENR